MSQPDSITAKPSVLWKTGRWALPAGFAAAVLGFSACSSGHSVTGTVNGQNYAAASGQLPSGFPSDVPTPSNSRVLGGGGAANNWNVAFAVTGSVSGATSAYQSKFSSAGYTVGNVQSGTAGSAAGSQFTATNSKWTVNVAGGSSGAVNTGGALKSGEFPLSVTVTPAAGGATIP